MPRAGTDDARRARRERALRVAGLYAVTPELADTADLVARVEAALDGGARAIQYRNKSAAAALKRPQAEALARVTAARGALFIVNDDAALCAEVDADGVHLGEDDGEHRRRARDRRPRTHHRRVVLRRFRARRSRGRRRRGLRRVRQLLSFARQAGRAPRRRRAACAARRRSACRSSRSAASRRTTRGELVRAGAHALAVISAVFDAPDVTAAARAIAAAFA